MRVAVWEYFNASDLIPFESLRREIQAEGRAMLIALVKDLLKVCKRVDVLWDPTLDEFPLTDARVYKTPSGRFESMCVRLTKRADLTLVIAPETDCILEETCELVASVGGKWCGVEPEAIGNASDKLQTCRAFDGSVVEHAPTFELSQKDDLPAWPAVIKPRLGAGCEDTVVVDTPSDVADIRLKYTSVIQPVVQGTASSVAGIGHDGVWRGLPVVRQDIVGDRQLRYQGGSLEVSDPAVPDDIHAFIADCADAIGARNGWLGIDFIERPDGSRVVVDVNPRLTTSYVAYRKATDMNLAEAIVRPLDGDIQWKRGRYNFTKRGKCRYEVERGM